RTDPELAGIHDLEQVNVFLVAIEISLEEGRVVVMEFAAREPEAPPVSLGVQLVNTIARDELRSRWNRIFHQQVTPVAAVHAQPYGNHIAGVDLALKRLKVVGDSFALLLRRQPVVVTGDIQGELVVLEKLFLRGVILAAGRPIEASCTRFLDADGVVSGAKLLTGE